MERTADTVIEEIKKNPEKHIHEMNALLVCASFNGAINTAVLTAHSEYLDLGTNGGVKCDVILGPCSCGAWHMKEEKRTQLLLKKYGLNLP